ncbi:unnamed protein product, partial [Tenebrio molitor]
KTDLNLSRKKKVRTDNLEGSGSIESNENNTNITSCSLLQDQFESIFVQILQNLNSIVLPSPEWVIQYVRNEHHNLICFS